MAKYHINSKTGDPGLCRADKGNCPFGSEEEHHSSAAEARSAFEAAMGKATEVGVAPVASRPAWTPEQKARRAKHGTAVFKASAPNSSRKEVAAFNTLMEQSYDAVKDAPGGSFAVADRMSREFQRRLDAEPDTFITYRGDHGDIADYAALAYVSPQLAEASSAFENHLQDLDWRTSAWGVYEPRSLALTFGKAAQAAGPEASADELATAFRRQAELDHWDFSPDDDDETRTELVAAARKARTVIRRDVPLYSEELKGF